MYQYSVHSEFGFFAEQPYDSIPNFTAADVLRLTGIGRNEFIDIMNKCRAKVSSSLTLGIKAPVVYFSFLVVRIQMHRS